MRSANIPGRIAALCLLPVLIVACSLPADEEFTPIDADELPDELANTTTTSTTTTTTTPPTTTVPTSVPSESAPTSSTTTTIPPLTTPVWIFYTDRTTEGTQALRQPLPEPSLQTVISRLESPPLDLASYGLRTSLAPGLIADAVLDRAVLTVSLNSSVFDPMSEDQKRQAIAQMVLTFTSFAVPGAGNIGAVVFLVDGAPIPVFIPADGTTAPEGTPVVYADFATLVIGTGASPPTSSGPPADSFPPTATSQPPDSASP